MIRPDPDDVHDRLIDEAVRVASMRSDDSDEMQDLPPEVAFRLVMERGRDAEEGGATVTVPAPHRPSPHDSPVALPLPAAHEPE